MRNVRHSDRNLKKLAMGFGQWLKISGEICSVVKFRTEGGKLSVKKNAECSAFWPQLRKISHGILAVVKNQW